MKILPLLAAVSVAVVSAAIGATESRAQSGPETHPYCALDTNGGTDCYFDSRQACGAKCIDNPWYTAGAGAMARTRNGTSRRSHR